MARKTSIEAYNVIKASGKLGVRAFQVYQVLYNFGPLTQAETWHQVQELYGKDIH